MKAVRVELQDTVQDFENCAFAINKETDCFEVFDSEDMYCPHIHIIAMFPKTSVIGIYYYDKETK